MNRLFERLFLLMIFISFQSCAQIEAKDGGNVEEEEQGKLQELAIKKIYLK